MTDKTLHQESNLPTKESECLYHCKTGKGMLDRLDNLVFYEGSKQILVCGKCKQTVMVSDWYNGKSFKKLLTDSPKCESCGVGFI